MIKRRKFRNEKEWRIIMTAGHNYTSRYEKTIGKPCLRTYLSSFDEIGLQKLISRVMCSPHGNIRGLVQNAQYLFRDCNSQLMPYRSNIDEDVVRNYITNINPNEKYVKNVLKYDVI